jgi:hypothetical protein
LIPKWGQPLVLEKEWPTIDKEKYKLGTDDEQINFKENFLDEMCVFLYDQVLFSHNLPRDDYKEFLELCLLFLGLLDPKGVPFKAPSAVHHARWVGKALNCLKIVIFQ